MAVNTPHIEYSKYIGQWVKLRDTAEGQEAIHAKTTEYLPKLGGQDDEEYNAYLTRALFYEATGRTIDGLSGMIFRKPPTKDLPTGLEKFSGNITLDGLSLQEFAEDIVDDGLTVGRAGILVDHPTVEDAALTVAEAEAGNIRPFLKKYKAEAIINWKVRGVANSQILVEVRLAETEEIPGLEFESETVMQIRVLDFNDAGQYRQRVYRKVEGDNKKDEWIQFGPDIIPLMNNKALDFIPFVFVGVKNSSADVEKPPLIGLANVNISHYKTTADLEHGAHFTALPTAVVTGAAVQTDDSGTPEEGEDYKIGSATAWVFTDPDTKAFFLEFKGQGLSSLENRATVKEQYMASLGARMLSPDKKTAETAETAQIHRLGENSVLASLSQSISASLEKALEIFNMWLGAEGDIVYQLNKDFIAISMTAGKLKELVAAWQAGSMAYADLLENLKKGEIINEERTEEEIRSEIETSSPFKGEDIA